MTNPQIEDDRNPSANRETIAGEDLTLTVVVLGTNFRFKHRERVYDADKVWSGEHTVRDFTEI